MKEFKDLLEKYGVTMKYISDTYGIPYETMKCWKSSSNLKGRSCPPYVLALLDKALEADSRPAPIKSDRPEPVIMDMGNDFTLAIVEDGDVYELWIRGAGIGVAEMMFVCPVSKGFKAAVDAGMRQFEDFKADYIADHMA